MTQAPVTDHPEQNQFVLDLDGQSAFIAYQPRGDVLDLTHTEVPEDLEGQGVGTRLVKGALALVRAQGQTIIPTCPFVAAYLKRHPEDADLVAAGQDR